MDNNYNFDSIFLQDIHSFHVILEKIFLNLDGRSLKNAMQVNSRWYNFIKHNIWGLKGVRGKLEHSLDKCWLRNYPRLTKFKCSSNRETVLDVQMDDKDIVVSFCYGYVKIWDRKTFERKGTLIRDRFSFVFLGLLEKYIVCGGYNYALEIWDRQSLTLVDNIRIGSCVYKLRCHGNFVSASIFTESVIRTYKFCQEEKPLKLVGVTQVIAACRFDCHENYVVVSSSPCSIKVYDFDKGETPLRTKQLGTTCITRLRLSAPYLAVTRGSKEPGVIILNFNTLEELHFLKVTEQLLGVELNTSRIVLITGSQNIMHGKLSEKSPMKLERIEGCAYQSNELGRNHFTLSKTSIISWSWHESMKGVVYIQDYWMGNEEVLDEKPQSEFNYTVSFFSKILDVIYRALTWGFRMKH